MKDVSFPQIMRCFISHIKECVGILFVSYVGVHRFSPVYLSVFGVGYSVEGWDEKARKILCV